MKNQDPNKPKSAAVMNLTVTAITITVVALGIYGMAKIIEHHKVVK